MFNVQLGKENDQEEIEFNEQDAILEEELIPLKCDSDGCDYEAKNVHLLERHRLGKHS